MLLLLYAAAITNSDLHGIDTIASHHPEVTLLGIDPTEVRIGHANVLPFWQDLCGALEGGLTTIPGGGSPEVITRTDGWHGSWTPTPHGDSPALMAALRPFVWTAVFRKEGHQWRLMQQHSSIGIPKNLLPFP